MRDASLSALARTIPVLREAIKTALNDNEAFHTALNGDAPIKAKGLAPDFNIYEFELSEALFWRDPEAYIDELERWQDAHLTDLHQPMIAHLRKTDQVPVFLDLVSAIHRKRVAPFVGAGLSQPYGYPLWGQAINILITKLEAEIDSASGTPEPGFEYLSEVKLLVSNWNYVDAAQLLYDNAKTQVDNFIRTKFSLAAATDTAYAHGAVRLLPDISDGCIITTNYDGLIEQIYIKREKPIEGYMHGTQRGNRFVTNLIAGDRCILKLHGDAPDHETYIFSKQQYDDAYGASATDYSKPLPKALRQIFVSHSLLFLGCSLEQDRTLTLLKEVVDNADFEVPDHFALVPNCATPAAQRVKEDHLLKLKIRPIWYEMPHHDHSAVEALLSLAIDCVQRRIKL